MPTASSLLVFAAACVLCANADEAAKERAGPETAWLTSKLLVKWLGEMGFKAELREERAVVTLNARTAHLIVAEFSDNDSIKLTTSWDSSQEDLGDGPIVNGWNNERRFCKVSISNKAAEAKGTLMVMHYDQLLPTSAGADAVRRTVKQSVELFETGVLEFDQFSQDTYRAWIKKRKETEA
eukprot:Rhum_TRINITY_DN14916_c12_g1::Rhum_TRINITY_DN14916_c12_g1_i1::g.128515::m.128515